VARDAPGVDTPAVKAAQFGMAWLTTEEHAMAATFNGTEWTAPVVYVDVANGGKVMVRKL
jgi:hypothetical protein